MADMIADPRHGIGGNKPPVAEQMRAEYPELFQKLDELAGVDTLIPAVIETDEQEGEAQDKVVQCRKTVKMAEAMHKLAKEPLDKQVKELKATFAIPTEKVEKAAKAILERLDVYKEKKAAAERRRREEEARKLREEQEAREKAAAEAEARRLEAERQRREEEERAAKAQREREAAEKAAKEANERAERAREEARKLEEQRKRQKEQDERDAAQRAKDDAERKERLAALKAEEEAAEAAKKKAREEAAQALADRRAAEEAAALAKREEKAAGREANTQLEDAVKMERRADRMDDAAQVGENELSRGRGDYGSVGSRVTVWKWRHIDRDKVPLEALRAYINPDAIDAAVTKFMNAHRAELGKGRDRDSLLRGVEFFQEQSTRVG